MELTFLITIALTALILAVTAGLFARNRGFKTLLAGLGLALLPTGAFLTQLTHLVVNGVESLIDWAQRTVWTDTTTWGVSLLGAGAVLLVIASLIPVNKRSAKGDSPRQVRSSATPAVGKAPAQPSSTATDQEEEEIEAILRKRGIM